MGRFFVLRCQMCTKHFVSRIHCKSRRYTSYMTSYKITYTNRCITQSWTGVRQYGQSFMLAVQRSHAS